MKWTIAYGGLAALGWAWGYGAGVGWSPVLLGVILSGTLPAALLLRWIQLEYTAPSSNSFPPSSTLSFAHRSWLGSAWGTGIVLICAWMFKGWSLPYLQQADFILDPVGALGWNDDWLVHMVFAVRVLMTIGVIGLIWGMYTWWRSINKNAPSQIVWAWALVPFFWMATLGLLMGVSEPWREAPDQGLSAAWSKATTPEKQKQLTQSWVDQSQSASKAVWAHAALIEGYRQGWLNQAEAYDGLNKLAKANQNRPSVLGFKGKAIVGVDAKSWCAFRPRADVKLHHCQEEVGRLWNVQELPKPIEE